MAEFIISDEYAPEEQQKKELVRCKDCKHKNIGNWCDAHMGHYPDEDWFCADGELADQNVTK